MEIGKEISIVSTCPARLFNDKHQGLWDGIQKYYPDVNFYFYHENKFEKGKTGDFIDFSNMTIPENYHPYDLFEEFPDLDNFLKTSQFSTCHQFNKNDFEQGYWRHNSIYWFRKAPAIYHAAQICKTPLLIFLDADSHVTPIGSGHGDEYTINDVYVNWAKKHDVLSRGRGHIWTETGHIVFNLEKRGKEFIDRFYDYYMSGKVFDLYRWDDCWVFDTLVKEMQISNGPLSKSKGAPGILEGIIDHNKGEWQHLRSSKKGI